MALLLGRSQLVTQLYPDHVHLYEATQLANWKGVHQVYSYIVKFLDKRKLVEHTKDKDNS